MHAPITVHPSSFTCKTCIQNTEYACACMLRHLFFYLLCIQVRFSGKRMPKSGKPRTWLPFADSIGNPPAGLPQTAPPHCLQTHGICHSWTPMLSWCQWPFWVERSVTICGVCFVRYAQIISDGHSMSDKPLSKRWDAYDWNGYVCPGAGPELTTVQCSTPYAACDTIAQQIDAVYKQMRGEQFTTPPHGLNCCSLAIMSLLEYCIFLCEAWSCTGNDCCESFLPLNIPLNWLTRYLAQPKLEWTVNSTGW